MASTRAPASDSFSVQGKIFDEATRNGIGNLLVSVYDVGPDIDNTGNGKIDGLIARSTRIGSVLSDSAGSFTFTYGEDDIPASGARRNRLNLLLVVSAPENEGGTSADRVIYHSSPPRTNAGRVENFTIGISRATQEKFGLSHSTDVAETIGLYTRLRSDEKELKAGVAAFHQASIEEDISGRSALREELLKVIETSAEAVTTTGEIVRGDDSIREKVALVGSAAMAKATERIKNSRGVQVNLYLTADDRERLKPFFDEAVDGLAVIPEHQLQDVLFRRNSSENPGTLLVHDNPIARYCADQTFEEKCAKQHIGVEDGGAGHHDGGQHNDGHDTDDGHDTSGGQDAGGGQDGGAVATTDANVTIQEALAKLLNHTPSPDDVLTPEFNDQQADRDSVQVAVDAFSLRRGPAEVPAFYDFDSLQIAFEHVWKVLVDEDVVDATYVLEQLYRNKTGVSLAQRFSQKWPRVLGDWPVYESVKQEIPADVAAQFDLSLEEWTDLSSSHQAKLWQIAVGIARACDPVPVVVMGGVLGTRLRVPAGCEKRQQDLREQGERIIDAVRHDDHYTLHKTLRELHARMSGTYEFTVFAADRNFHSVNFGLLNTYRQQWTPITYQAGKLIKTIALSPKEERKYSLKTTRNTKQTRKEAVKNNTSLKNEQSTTSRVESEIVAKAQSKTNFTLSTDGSYNIGISKGKATTTFGVEAQQESAESRKDLREGMHKAAQEYLEERHVQIDTEENLSSEYSESGTIQNQNDELAQTCLFYELRELYQVFQEFYRCAPVCLVAQEVPAPHEITESWVISHDWIINRCLLDDSFRPTLRYLADKSVGDDFAIRELRRNLRQQRSLVESLRVELSTASDEADNRYRGLENAIEKRIGEESAESTDGWFADVGDFFGGGGQDPEAAKARELAAKDAHQFAVEKAGKAAAALRQEVGTLHTLTREYNTTLRDHLDNETRVKRLLVHLRNNVLYYMQAIWSMEPPDQMFLRLHTVQVPQLDLARVPDPANPDVLVPDRTYRVEVIPRPDIFEDFREPGTTKHRAFMTGTLEPVTRFRPLVEVADLDNPRGFKGNYMIFPLKEHNALTEFMAGPYVDAAFGAMDPDELSNVNLRDYSAYICCLHDKLPPDEFEALKPKLRGWLKILLADPLRNGDEIVVPTDSLFIELLPGTHPLLENFKLRHRELDVYKVLSDVRKAELANLRLAARLLNGELDDPEVDKKVLIAGNPAVVVDPDQ